MPTRWKKSVAKGMKNSRASWVYANGQDFQSSGSGNYQAQLLYQTKALTM
jgi:hypothetical protein